MVKPSMVTSPIKLVLNVNALLPGLTGPLSTDSPVPRDGSAPDTPAIAPSKVTGWLIVTPAERS